MRLAACDGCFDKGASGGCNIDHQPTSTDERDFDPFLHRIVILHHGAVLVARGWSTADNTVRNFPRRAVQILIHRKSHVGNKEEIKIADIATADFGKLVIQIDEGIFKISTSINMLRVYVWVVSLVKGHRAVDFHLSFSQNPSPIYLRSVSLMLQSP